jgi:hypothetical protein
VELKDVGKSVGCNKPSKELEKNKELFQVREMFKYLGDVCTAQ